MNDIKTINKIYEWADKNAYKYERLYQENGSPSSMRSFEKYDDIRDICQLAREYRSEVDEDRRRRMKNQNAIIDSLKEQKQFEPDHMFSYDDVEQWMRKLMI